LQVAKKRRFNGKKGCNEIFMIKTAFFSIGTNQNQFCGKIKSTELKSAKSKRRKNKKSC